MTKLEIKDNVDEMLVQIVKYIKACDLSEDEDTEILIDGHNVGEKGTKKKKKNTSNINNSWNYFI